MTAPRGTSRSTGPSAHEVPLLYATTDGAPYERYEIERVSGPRWPYGEMEFTVRLIADGGGTVVEQRIAWSGWAGLNPLSMTDRRDYGERPARGRALQRLRRRGDHVRTPLRGT